jgi:hypothetical protein
MRGVDDRLEAEFDQAAAAAEQSVRPTIWGLEYSARYHCCSPRVSGVPVTVLWPFSQNTGRIVSRMRGPVSSAVWESVCTAEAPCGD